MKKKNNKNLIIAAVIGVLVVAGVAVFATQGDQLQGYLRPTIRNVSPNLTVPRTPVVSVQDFTTELETLTFVFGGSLPQPHVALTFKLPAQPELDKARLYIGGNSRKVKLNSNDQVVDHSNASQILLDTWYYNTVAVPGNGYLDISVPISAFKNATSQYSTSDVDGISGRAFLFRTVSNNVVELELCKGTFCEKKALSPKNIRISW